MFTPFLKNHAFSGLQTSIASAPLLTSGSIKSAVPAEISQTATPGATVDPPGTRVSLSETSRQHRLEASGGSPSPLSDEGEQALENYAALGRASRPATPTHTYQRMLDRLYRGQEPSLIEQNSNIPDWDDRSPVEFLTRSDRQLIASVYQYAEESGINARHVDDLAHALGSYRQAYDGKKFINFNSGGMYDAEWRPQTVDFVANEAEVVKRIQDGKAIASTSLDQGFLRFQLDPGYSALGPYVDFRFLEKVIQRFSNEAQTDEVQDHSLGSYRVKELNEIAVITSHEEGRLPLPEEPDVIRHNDQWIITERGKAKGITMAQILGKESMPYGSMAAGPAASTLREATKNVLDNARFSIIEGLLQEKQGHSDAEAPKRTGA